MTSILEDVAKEFVVKGCARVGCGRELRVPVEVYEDVLHSRGSEACGRTYDGFFVSGCKKYYCSAQCFNDDIDC